MAQASLAFPLLSPCPATMAKKGKNGNGNSMAEQNKTLMEQVAMLTELVKELKDQLKALRGGQSSDTPTAPSPVAPKGEKEKGPKIKEPTSNPHDQEWVKVKGPETKESKAASKPGLQLRTGDWTVAILKPADFKDGAIGVGLLPQKEGERLAKDLAHVSGKMGLLTPKPIEKLKGREMDVKATNEQNRMVIVRRFLTLVGDPAEVEKGMKAEYESRTKTKEATLELEDSSVKVVLKAVKGWADDYPDWKKLPAKKLETWMTENGVKEHLLYSYRPAIKAAGGNEWVEAVLTVKAARLPQLHANSGQGGIFVSKFRTGAPEDNAWKVVWFEKGETLEDALGKTKLLPDAAGLVCTSKGLGIRLPTAGFKEKVKKIFGQERANKEDARGNRQFFEIQKCPPWVDGDSLVNSLKAKWGWEVQVVRVVKGWNTKTLIVGASTAPPKDAAVIDNHWLPIQTAKPVKKGETQKLVPKKKAKPQRDRDQNRRPAATESQQTPKAPEVQRSGEGTDMFKMMQNFLGNINRRFDDFEASVGGRLTYIEQQLDDEMEEDDEEDEMSGQEDGEQEGARQKRKRNRSGA